MMVWLRSRKPEMIRSTARRTYCFVGICSSVEKVTRGYSGFGSSNDGSH